MNKQILHFSLFPSPFLISKEVSNRGYDIFPVKKENGLFKVVVWLNDEYLREGKIEYKTWKKAVEETNKKIYKALINNK